MKEIFIIRHARTTHNLGEDPSLDSPITTFGWNQAKLLGKFFRKQRLIDDSFSLFVSPFLRTVQTADFMWKEMGESQDEDALENLCREKFTVQPLAHEYLGHYHFKDGKKEFHVPNRDGFRSCNWSGFPKLGMNFAHETNEEFMHRIRRLYQSLPERSVVVTHGLPAFALMHVASDPSYNHMPVWDWCIDNASVTWVKDGRIIWRGLNLFWEEESWAYGLTRERYDEAL
jgi:broad specificity phosphatase PhoE